MPPCSLVARHHGNGERGLGEVLTLPPFLSLLPQPPTNTVS